MTDSRMGTRKIQDESGVSYNANKPGSAQITKRKFCTRLSIFSISVPGGAKVNRIFKALP